MKDSNPLVSIIIPVYNVKSYLKEAVDSALTQSYEKLEIILIDDGSTDGSETLCDELKEKDKRIKVFHRENGGLSSARNYALDKIKGDYVCFLDSDDSLTPDFVSYNLNQIEKFKTSLSISGHYEKREGRNLKPFSQKSFTSEYLSSEECLKRMLKEEGFMVSAWGKLYASDLFNKGRKVRFPEGKLHEDVGTTYRLILKAKDIAFGPIPKYIYNIRKSSITNKGFSSNKLDLIELTDKMCDKIDEEYPNLKKITNLRRIHSRFSIYRQIVKKKKLSPGELEEKENIKNYIKKHQNWIFKNPESSKKDRLAMRSFLLGEPVFKISWAAYERFFK